MNLFAPDTQAAVSIDPRMENDKTVKIYLNLAAVSIDPRMENDKTMKIYLNLIFGPFLRGPIYECH